MDPTLFTIPAFEAVLANAVAYFEQDPPEEVRDAANRVVESGQRYLVAPLVCVLFTAVDLSNQFH